MVDVSTDAAVPTGVPRAQWLAGCLQRARDGESAALDEVVRELNPLLWHVARSQGLTAEDAADVVQTTWLEFVRQLAAIHSPLALTGWLVSTTRRQAWQVKARRRRQAGEPADSIDGLPDPGPGVDELVITDQRHRQLWHHVQRLPERCRELLRIVAFVDRPDYAAVAEALQMPRGSIGPTRGRCLAKLRELLLADPTWSA